LNIKITTKPNWLLLILSVLLFISIFLPWWSWTEFLGIIGYSYSFNGFHGFGILTFLMSLVGAALSFIEFPNPKNRSYAIIGVGVLALLGALIAFAQYSPYGLGWGRIISIIFSILIIVDGFYDYRGVDLWAKIKAGTSKTPSSQPPPPPPPPASPPPAKP
jgi:membrane-bound ClpP family serine protease